MVASVRLKVGLKDEALVSAIIVLVKNYAIKNPAEFSRIVR
jgi:hypothetical protein